MVDTHLCQREENERDRTDEDWVGEECVDTMDGDKDCWLTVGGVIVAKTGEDATVGIHVGA